jgi:hypothetical protein
MPSSSAEVFVPDVAGSRSPPRFVAISTSILRDGMADVPIEGYYTGDVDLTTYFRLMRALQAVSLSRASEIEAMPQFQRCSP